MTKNINEFYQQIDVNNNGNIIKHDIFDYRKIWEDVDEHGNNILLYVIISERGRKTKTTQGKVLSKWLWTKLRIKTMWGMNSEKIISKEKKSHLTKPKIHYPELFTGDEYVEGNFVYEKPKGDWYQKFVPLSLAEQEKGSRSPYGLFVVDEYNVGDRQIKGSKVDLFSSLIATMDDPINSNNPDEVKLKKIILHANNKSLNDPFLISLGIYSIKEEVTDIKVGNRVIGRVLAPIPSESDRALFEEQNKDNAIYLLQKKLGKADHVYFNDNAFDDLNYVNQWMVAIKPVEINKQPIVYNVKIKNLYYQLRTIDTEKFGRVIYMINLPSKPEGICFVFNKKDIIENTVFNPNMKKSMFKQLANEKVFFFSAYIREEFIKVISS